MICSTTNLIGFGLNPRHFGLNPRHFGLNPPHFAFPWKFYDFLAMDFLPDVAFHSSFHLFFCLRNRLQWPLDGHPSTIPFWIFENQDVGVTELECFEKDTGIGGAIVLVFGWVVASPCRLVRHGDSWNNGIAGTMTMVISIFGCQMDKWMIWDLQLSNSSTVDGRNPMRSSTFK